GRTSEVAARIRQAEELTTLAAPGNGPGSTAKWEIPRSTHHSARIERGQGCRSRFAQHFSLPYETIAYNVNVSLVRELSTVRTRMVWTSRRGGGRGIRSRIPPHSDAVSHPRA